METYLNILHYCFYKAHYKMHLLANKVNPFRLLFKLPIVKRKAEKEGVSLDEAVNTAFGDKNFGLSMMVAGGALLGLLFFFFFMVIIFLLRFLISKHFVLSTVHFVVCAVLSVAISYFFVFKEDKYIMYFDKFEGWTKSEKRKYSWLTFVSTTAVFVLWILSFTLKW